ncbi:MAG: FG-GAP-like repeat-containing protein, partial [Ignavibacteriaceae bacterium]
WYKNDGNENFTSHTITTSTDGTYSVYAVDVEGDGDIDVLSASVFDNKIAWFENDGNENFTPHTITTNAYYANSVYGVDVDGDGDMDVLSASRWDNKIAWYENLTPMPPVVYFSAYPTSGIVPLTVQFTDSSTGTITDWLWDFGDDSTSTEQNPTHTYFVADTFTVSLSVSGPGGSNTLIRENYIIVTDPASIQELSDDLPTEFKLYNNYPNPFNPTTKIKYQIPELSFVTLKVFDVLGSEVATLVNEEKPAGSYEVEYNTIELPSGIYFYSLQAGEFVETKKMVLLR